MDDTKEWNLQTHSNRLLELPHDLLLRILQLLPMKTVYEACLVHREAILPEARSVLWEAPRFRSGTRASQFLNIVRSSKRHALLVRSLYLCVLEEQDPMFPIVSKSSLTLHQQQNTNSLSDPKLILLLTKACEKITSLTFYSDNIESSHLAQVAATAIHLSSLTLIGSKIKEAPYIKGFLSRIQSITLDGKFIISDDWATQMSRATHLTSLQISLSGIAIPVLEKLCRNVPLLTDLTLTDASNFQDRDVQIVTGFFPNLESFTLQGTVHVTEVALFAALSSCSELEHLKLRANVNTNGTPADSLERYGMPPDHIVIYLQTLVLENIMMDDRWFLLMSSKLHHLKYVGLKSCPHLTDTSVGALLKECPQINTFYVEDCIGVSLGVFSNQMASLLSLRRLSFISSGALTTSDIYQLCATGKLLYFYVTATPQLKNSVLAEKINSNNVLELNKEDMIQMAQSKESALTLPNRVHVLTHEHVSQLAKRLNLSLRALETILDDITGRNEILSIDNSTLDYDGYSNVNNNNNNKSSNKNINNNNNSNTEDDDQDEEDTHHSSPTKFSDISDNSFISQDWLNEFDDKRASETEGAYSDSDDNNDNNDNNDSDDDAYNEQPPAKGDGAFPDWESQGDCLSGLNDWPNQTKGNGDASSIQEWPGNDWLNQDNSCESLTEQDHDGGGDLIAGLWEEQHHGNKKWQSNSDENDSSGSVEDKETNGRVIKEEWALKQHNDNIPTLWDWQSQINNNDTTNNTNASMSNGDHGNTSAEEWPLPGDQKPLTSKAANKPKNAWENVPDTIRSSNTRLSHQTCVYDAWNPQVAEAEVRQLIGTAMSGQQSRSKQVGHGRTQPRVVDEGWGNIPQKYLPWSDVNRHGFNEEIIDKQKNTVFWRKENGEWKVCGKEFAEASTNAGETPPPSSSPGRGSRNHKRTNSYQSSADSYTEDHTRNKWPKDARLTPDPPKSAKWPHDKYEKQYQSEYSGKSKLNNNIPNWNTFKESTSNNNLYNTGNEAWNDFEMKEARNNQRSPQNQSHGNSSTDGSIEHNSGSFFPKSKTYSKNPRNTRKTARQVLSPEKMAGQWGDLFGQESVSPKLDHKSQSPPNQADASLVDISLVDISLVDIIDEFSPNRMNVHQTTPQPIMSNWNTNDDDLANCFDGNDNITKNTNNIVDFTHPLESEKKDTPSPMNDTTITKTSIIASVATSEIVSQDTAAAKDPVEEWDALFNNNSSNNSNTSPIINNNVTQVNDLFEDGHESTTESQQVTTATATMNIPIINVQKNSPSPLLSPSSPSSVASTAVSIVSAATLPIVPTTPSEKLFTTKIKFNIVPSKVDIIHINKDNVREKLSALLEHHGIHDDEKLDKMTIDATNYLVKKEMDRVLKVKRKKNKN